MLPAPNYFGQLLSVLSSHELAMLQPRLNAKHLFRLSEILQDEIHERYLSPNLKAARTEQETAQIK
jgi:hypothetical protein